MGFRVIVICLTLCFTISSPTQAQNPEVWNGGIRVGQLFADTELQDHYGINAYVFFRGNLKRYILLEIGGGYGQYEGIGYSTDVWLGELKLVFKPWRGRRIHPLVYIGTGLTWHNIQLFSPQSTPDAKKTGWTPIVPGGFGFQFPLTKHIRFEVLSGYTYTYRDDLNSAILVKGNDGFFHWTAGFTFGTYIKPRPPKSIPKSKKIPVLESLDDDQDGLSDQDELNIYHTNPDQSDTDKDGLTDYEEVRQYFTNPNQLDSDADGLIDSEEVRAYKTNPHQSDTDGDGLSDGQEVITYRTDPLKKDTDGDGMSDGEEIVKGRDPLTKD